MSVPPETPTTVATPATNRDPGPAAAIHLEPRFLPATESQHLTIETALRLLAVWAVRAAGPPPDST